jgi:4-hydroxybenzoate polyprenyltransferase
VSNVPTVWSNVLAGTAAAVAVISDPGRVAQVAAASSLFYIGGMFLNDAFDAAIDARERPERPLPAGDVSRREVFTLGVALLGAGFALLPRDRVTLLFGAALAAAIGFYDYRHKGDRLAPFVMGLCRGLVYCIAGAAAATVSTAVLAGAFVMASYVSALTVVARVAGANARWLVPLLIAGISLVDAVVIAVVSQSASLALLAAIGFPLTLLLQRAVPGD